MVWPGRLSTAIDACRAARSHEASSRQIPARLFASPLGILERVQPPCTNQGRLKKNLADCEASGIREAILAAIEIGGVSLAERWPEPNWAAVGVRGEAIQNGAGCRHAALRKCFAEAPREARAAPLDFLQSPTPPCDAATLPAPLPAYTPTASSACLAARRAATSTWLAALTPDTGTFCADVRLQRSCQHSCRTKASLRGWGRARNDGAGGRGGAESEAQTKQEANSRF